MRRLSRPEIKKSPETLGCHDVTAKIALERGGNRERGDTEMGRL